MSSEPTSDALERASAYVDNALAPDERHEIEASAEMMGWVASFTTIRAQLATAPPAPAAQRDEAIAAAIAELDPSLASSTTSTHDALVRTLPRRSRWFTAVSSAAAAVILLVVGVTLTRNDGDNSNLATPAELSADATAAETGADSLASGGAPAAATSDTLGAITGPATVLPAVDNPEQLQAYAAEAPKVATYATEASVAGETAPAATSAADVAAASSRVVVPPPACLAADAVVLGSITVGGTAATAIRTSDGQLQAIDAQCTVLLTASP